MKKTLVILGLMIFIVGCTWHNEEELFTEKVNCDTIQVSFSSDVVPILSSRCYTCHSNSNAPDFAFGLSLEDYEDVSSSADRIVGAINHREGFFPMPQGQLPLDSCQINTIEAWINQGSIDN